MEIVQGTHPAVIVADTTAVSVAAATFMGYLPNIAAVLSIIWLTIQILNTIDTWVQRRKYYRGDKGDSA